MPEPSNLTYRQWLFGTIVVALITTAGVVTAAFLTRPQPEVPAAVKEDWRLGIEVTDGPDGTKFERIEAIEQHVNKYVAVGNKPLPAIDPDIWRNLQKGVERATFRFVVGNLGPDTTINGATVLIEKVHAIDLGGIPATLMITNLLDHRNHLVANISMPRLGDEIPLNINMTLAHDASREIVIWFRSHDSEDVIVFDARLRLNVGHNTIVSEPFRVEIHTETNQFPNFDGSPQQSGV